MTVRGIMAWSAAAVACLLLALCFTFAAGFVVRKPVGDWIYDTVGWETIDEHTRWVP